jgi:phospholipid/cholesterol/gamma-HCH transport system substrate-binding protein
MSGPLDALRRRIDIVPAQHRTRPLLVGAIVITVTFLAILGAATRSIPFLPKSGREVRAEFADATQVSNRTVVRVGGVEVGRVDKVEAGSPADQTSVVKMRITDDDIVLHRDASAEVRWRTLFGGLMYIDLHPGSPSAPELGDAAIPKSRTSSQVELDQILQPYDGRTDDAQRTLLKELRSALANPRGVARTLDTLPVLRTVRLGTKPLRGRESDDLRRLVAATAKTVSGLADTQSLKGLVTGGSRALAVTDARRQDLGEMLELSPPSLDSTFITMRRLRTTLDHLDPLAVSLRPGARALAPAARAATPALRQTEAVLREVRPLLTAAAPTFDSLRGASRAGVPLMKGLDPTLSRLDKELLPYLGERDNETRLRNYESIGPFWAALSAAAAEFDSEGYRIRLTVPMNTNSVVNAPFTGALTTSCLRSGLDAGRASCSQAATSLARAWFGRPGSKGGTAR